MSIRRAVVIAAMLALSGGVHAQSFQPIREGDGPRRADLNRMELKPFPAEAWGKLSDWKNTSALTSAEIGGKVVLILTWADYVPTSQKALDLAKRLAEAKAKDGLVVVCAHAPKGWDEANKPKAGNGAGLYLAHDAKGEFRSALKSDADPDFYVIDKAGQLRFADITTESVQGAVEALLAESAGDAGKVNERLAAERAEAEAELRRAASINQQLDYTNIPELPFEKPSPEAYQRAKWPKVPKDPNAQQYGGENKKPEPKPISLPSDTDFFPKKPEMNGRVTLVYVWHPKYIRSFEREMPRADLLQRQYGRDLVVVGALVVPNTNAQQLAEEDKDPEKLRVRMQEFAKARQTKHAFVLDAGNTLLNTVLGNQNEFPVPFYILIGTDGLAHWWTTPEAMDPMGPLLTMLENDPGVLARRKAEEEYVKARKK
jgi:hypothetical protein